MATIRDLAEPRAGQPGSPWRTDLLPANFRGALFHVESGSKENGRRIVMHEYPKKDYPYAEDMGRRAYEFSVRGYCITYPYDAGVSLYSRDYRIARDLLEAELTSGIPGPLQLPTMNPIVVVCPRWRLIEEERFGGYCIFDMQFQELGLRPGEALPDTRGDLIARSKALRTQIIAAISNPQSRQR